MRETMLLVAADVVRITGSLTEQAVGPRLEQVATCPMCGAGDFAVAFESPDLLHGVPGVYHYVACERCGTVLQNPRVRPEDVDRCYPPTYFTHATVEPADVVAPGSLRDRLRQDILRRADRADRSEAVPDPDVRVRLAGQVLAKRASWRRRARFGLLDPLGLPAPGARCLEFGPGQGHDLRNMTRLGWEATGLEVDPVAAALAARTSGCEVVAGTLADAPWPDQSFDLVYGSHVFEHLLEPVEALHAVWRLLRPGGRLVLVYPNPRSACARVFGRLALTWDPPRHIFLAPRGAVRDCLTQIGFWPVQVTGLARRAYGYAERARLRQPATVRTRPWQLPAVVHAAEVAGVALRLDVGEELLVTATRPGSEGN